MKKLGSYGFTLIELLVVIGVIGILAAIVLVAVNPGRQFAQARDTQRRSDLYSITNTIYQFAAEHDGNLPDTDGDDATSDFPTTATCMSALETGEGSSSAGCFDIAQATDAAGTEVIVPTYIARIPTDPSTGTPDNTQYLIHVDANGRVVASASGELAGGISIIR